MDVKDERYRRGVEILQLLSGNGVEQVTNRVAEVAPDFARMTIGQLRVHVAAALNLGLSRAEVVEILMQTAIYAGFPPALNALAECHDLLVPDAQTEDRMGD